MFSFFFGLVCVMNHKHEALWPLKRCRLYILCILSNSFHLTIGSSLTLIQNEFWIPKYCFAHLILFFLCLRFPKIAIKISLYYKLIIFDINHFFGCKMVKKGSSIVCFHPNPCNYYHYIWIIMLTFPYYHALDLLHIYFHSMCRYV